MVGIITDTTAGIPAELVQQLGIELVTYYVNREGESLRDMVEIGPDEFAEYLRTVSKLPTTSTPGPGDYLSAFQNLASRTKEIIVLTMTSKASGAYQACKTAVDMVREQFPDLELKIQIVDTLKVAMVQGWAAIEAARAAAAGASQEQTLAVARQVADLSFMIQTADTLRYLYMGGRIGRAKHLLASLLNVKPLIGIDDGLLVALGTARSRLKAYARIVELVGERCGAGSKIKVAFTHCAAPEELTWLRERVRETFDVVEEMTSPLSPALAVHSGPGTVGVCVYPIRSR